MQALALDHQASQTNRSRRILEQISQCLHRGCVICIEHALMVGPRYTRWQQWGDACCYNGDQDKLYNDIDSCRQAHADHHIRLSIDDFSSHSRFSVFVHRPDMPDSAQQAA